MLSMLPPNDEMRVLETRMASLEEFQDRIRPAPSDDGISEVVQTTTDGAYPTAAGRVYACETLDIDADDTEGSGATYTADGGRLYATNLGASVPPSGTRLIATSAGGRWTITYNG